MRVLPLLGVAGSVECYGDEQGAADGDRRFLLFLSVSALFAIARGNQVWGGSETSKVLQMKTRLFLLILLCL